jgi:hypothetical protein
VFKTRCWLVARRDWLVRGGSSGTTAPAWCPTSRHARGRRRVVLRGRGV